MKSLLLLPLALLAACSSGTAGDAPDSSQGLPTGQVRILATDGPIDPALVRSAKVELTKIRMHRESEDEEDSGWITLFEGGPIEVDLAGLRNGITQAVASGELEVGSYRQVRLHLSGGRIELENGNVYSTDSGTLDLPGSTTSSGYKVFLDPPVEIPDGGVEHVLIDFDLTKTFLPIPANDPENARRFKLRPVVRGAVMSLSGELRAVVRRDDGTGTLVGVPDAMVYVLAAGELDPENAIASSITDGTGSAAVLGLLPGSYDVLASEGGTEARVDANVVSTGEVTLVELELP